MGHAGVKLGCMGMRVASVHIFLTFKSEGGEIR